MKVLILIFILHAGYPVKTTSYETDSLASCKAFVETMRGAAGGSSVRGAQVSGNSIANSTSITAICVPKR